MPEQKQNADLEVYLKDHYAGGFGALELIEHLCRTHAEDAHGKFFVDLYAEVKTDHEQLHDLMKALGCDDSNIRNAGAWMAEKFGRAKLGFSSGEDAKLRLLQSLESLHLGITGKASLWRALDAVKDSSPVLEQTDFTRLEKRALEQAARVDRKRLDEAGECLRAR